MRRIGSAALRSLIIVAGCLALATCGGDSTGPTGGGGYFFRFSANGSLVSFTRQSSLVATFTQSGTQYGAVMSGSDDNSNANVQVYSAAPVAAGTYSGFTVSGTALEGVIMGYDNAAGTMYSTSGGAVEASATITQLTETSIRGTFTARLRATGQADLVVTNGEFFLRRVN